VIVSKSKPQYQELVRLTPGCYFGDISLVIECPVMATITSSTAIVLLKIQKDDFTRFFSETPDLLAEFEIKVLGPRTELRHVIKHSIGLQLFRRHLEGEFSTENIDFWVAAKEFEDADTAAKRTDIGQRLWTEFVSAEATRQVNLKAAVRDPIHAQVLKKHYPFDLYSKARDEIFFLMEKDNYERFRKGPLFSVLLTRIGSYRALDNSTFKQAVDQRLSQRHITLPHSPSHGHPGGARSSLSDIDEATGADAEPAAPAAADDASAPAAATASSAAAGGVAPSASPSPGPGSRESGGSGASTPQKPVKSSHHDERRKSSMKAFEALTGYPGIAGGGRHEAIEEEHEERSTRESPTPLG
jgi:hypothetical protein